MERVRIELPAGAAETYEILIEPGLYGRAGTLIATAAPAARYAIVTDSNVAPLFAPTLADSLPTTSTNAVVMFAAGERNKTRATWADVSDRLLAAGIGRDACIVALGGGVVGDLAGFVAATYLRGIPYVQVPTTLLAMIDASVGGKTGVDAPAGKNLVGAFLQPKLVAIDPALLSTLPLDDLRHGLAEAIKHGAIADASYLDWIEAETDAILARDAATLAQLVRRSVEIKADVVRSDPLERGRRAVLNFGHTIAHAIERVSEYGVPHGRAVAAGMVAEARIAEDAGIALGGTTDRVRRVLTAVGFPAESPTDVDVGTLLAAASSDKKARAGRLRWALIAEPGRVARGPDGAWTHELDDGKLRESVAAYLASA